MKLSKDDSVRKIEGVMGMTESVVKVFRAVLIAGFTIDDEDLTHDINTVTRVAAEQFDASDFAHGLELDLLNDYFGNNIPDALHRTTEMVHIIQDRIVARMLEGQSLEGIDPEDFANCKEDEDGDQN